MTQAEYDYTSNHPATGAGRDIGAVFLAFAAGAFAAILIVTPIFVREVRHEIQAAWDEDVAAWSAQCDRAYQQGKADAERLQALAREVAP